MDRDEDDAQLTLDQHHPEVGSPRAISQNFGMAGEGDAGRLQRFLVDRRRYQRGDLPGHGEVDGADDRGMGERAGPRIHAAERQIGGQFAGREHRQDRISGVAGNFKGLVQRLVVFAWENVHGGTDDLEGFPHPADVADHEKAVWPGGFDVFRDDFRANAGGIAHGDRDWQGHRNLLMRPGRGRAGERNEQSFAGRFKKGRRVNVAVTIHRAILA